MTAALSGDRGAREDLARTWGPVVLCWCARFGGPRIDSEDAAHDVFVIVLSRLPSLRDPQAFPSWLYRITQTVVRRRRRSAWWKRVVTGDVLERPDPCPGPEARVGIAEDVRQVFALLDELPRDLREMLVLCDVEKHTEAETAALAGIPAGTVKSRLHRARQAFKRRAVRLRLDTDWCETTATERLP